MTLTRSQKKAEADRPKAEAATEKARVSFSGKVLRLTGHMIYDRVKKSALDAAFASGITAESFATDLARREPVGLAIHPLKEAAVKRASEHVVGMVAKATEELEAAGWDLQKVAPYPRHDGNYYVAIAKYRFFGSLVEHLKGSRRPSEPDIVKMNQKSIDRFIARAEEDAAFQYDMFICKMVSKIGGCVSAELDGSHVWGHSFLTVSKPDGSVELWKTQQITNTSKLGMPFSQWPSRKVKSK